MNSFASYFVVCFPFLFCDCGHINVHGLFFFFFLYCLGQGIRPEKENGCLEPYITNGSEISFRRRSCHIHNSNGEPLEKASVFHFYIQEHISFLEKAIQISDNDDQAVRRYTPDDLVLQNISINRISALKPMPLETGDLFLCSIDL